MVLIFESKTYESITQRIIFSIFKYGYIAQKYKLFYKLLYSIEIVIESLLLFFMLSVSYDDLIDEQGIIKLDNALADVLDILGDVVDGFGGLYGILTTIGGFIAQKFAKEMQKYRDS